MKYVKKPKEGLTKEEIEGLANMLMAYGELTQSVELLKKELMLMLSERANLAYVCERDGLPYTFVPNLSLYKRVMKSKKILNKDDIEKLSKIGHFFKNLGESK